MLRYLTRLRRSTATTTHRCKHADNVIIDQPLDIPTGPSDVSNKTRVSFLSQDMMDTDRIGIRGLSSIGFRMYDGSFLYGPIALFPTVALSWRVPRPEDITAESLKLFLMLQPPLDVLVIGVGERSSMDEVRRAVMPEMRKHKIGLELLPTEDAIPTFNFLNSEYRYVAGAFYPPAELVVTARENSGSMSMVTPLDTVSENPFIIDFAVSNPAKEAIQRLYGEGSEGAEAFAHVEGIRLKDRQQKLDRIREYAGRLGEKERNAYLAGKEKLRAALEEPETTTMTTAKFVDNK